jgi:hypothetical protein
MWKLIRAAATALSMAIAGCSIHPLPEDVTGVNTYHIVRQIRCEARDTLRTIITEWLEKLAAKTSDPLLQQLASQYRANPASFNSFHYSLFKGSQYAQIRSLVKLFYDAGIAYNFDLTGTETNDLNAELSFLKTFSDHGFSLGINGGLDRTRQNERTFTITDTFSKLLTKVPEQYCDGQIAYANYIYPVVGRIGIDRTIRSFIELTLFADLSGAAAAAPPTMTDDLTFTTAIKSNVNPIVVFTPITNALQLTRASLAADNNRIDRHQVTIGLAIAPTGLTEVQPLRSYLFSANRVAPIGRGPAMTTGGLVIGGRVTGGGTATERLAVLAIDQVKTREIQLIPSVRQPIISPLLPFQIIPAL